MLTEYNNLRQFINIKSLSSRQVWWAQKLFRYHFQIDYHQKNANGAIDALSYFPQKNQAEDDNLQTGNTQILHKLQSLLTNASLSGLNTSAKLLPLYWVLICETYVLPQLWKFWDNIQSELINKELYKVSIGGIKLKLLEL